MPVYLGFNTYFFGNKAKKIKYSDFFTYAVLDKDTMTFNTFRYNENMDLTKLGEEIVVFKNK